MSRPAIPLPLPCLTGLRPHTHSVDNSEFMRNSDFLPTRLQAQQDAVTLVCHSKYLKEIDAKSQHHRSCIRLPACARLLPQPRHRMCSADSRLAPSSSAARSVAAVDDLSPSLDFSCIP